MRRRAPNPHAKTHAITVRVDEETYQRICDRVAGPILSPTEVVYRIVEDAVRPPAKKPLEQILVEEVLALRRIIMGLYFSSLRRDDQGRPVPVTADTVKELKRLADADKGQMARDLMVGTPNEEAS